MIPTPLSVIGGAALGTVPALLSSMSPTARAQRQVLREDVDKLRKGKLGMSQAERAGAQQNLMRTTETAVMGAEDDLRRQAAAQGFGRSAAQQEAGANLQQKKLEAVAKGTAAIDVGSSQLAEKRKADILRRTQAQNKQNQADVQEAFGGAVAGGQLAYGIDQKLKNKLADTSLGTP